jgi:hypothetical protein
MKTRGWQYVVGGLVGALLSSAPSAAAQGGLPACQAQLATCAADLASCEAALDTCGTFPGDGLQGTPLQYVDHGNGTATDPNTLLLWEVKDNSGTVHDSDFRFTYSSSGIAPDGTVFTVFLAALNTPPCFAGHCDWRLPHVKELQSLVDYSIVPLHTTPPTTVMHASFPGLTVDDFYMTATPVAGSLYTLWSVGFALGSVTPTTDRSAPVPVRAVRTGP